MGLNIKDAALKVTKSLPNGAASVTADGFDLGHGTSGDFLALTELKITAPALTTSELPNTKTITYAVEHDDASDFSSATVVADAVLVQTGSGGAGASAASATFRGPVDVKRYLRVKATNSGAGDASAKSFTVELLF